MEETAQRLLGCVGGGDGEKTSHRLEVAVPCCQGENVGEASRARSPAAVISVCRPPLRCCVAVLPCLTLSPCLMCTAESPGLPGAY